MKKELKKITLNINGMSCANCEILIETKLEKIKGIDKVKANFSNSKVTVFFEKSEIDEKYIINYIEKIGYKVEDINIKKGNIIELIYILIIIFGIYYIIQKIGFTDIFKIFPKVQNEASYLALFVIGLFTSIHCVAMCGGINISQSMLKNKTEKEKDKMNYLRTNILYNLGRVISYTIVGGIVGTIGSVISFSNVSKGIISVLVGIFMVIMGLNMLNLFPFLKRLNIKIPKIISKKISKINTSKYNNLFIGLLNGFIPCGPLQSMQIYALSTGSFAKGALSMFAFSLGTVPLMLGIGLLSSILNKKIASKMFKISSVLVIILGIFMFNSGMVLSGFTIPSFNYDNTYNNLNYKILDGVQVITTNLESGNYTNITVKKGIPVKFIIKAEEKNINGCNNKIIIPKYNIVKDLVVGENIIDFIPQDIGEYSYSCWMGMIRNNIRVID